MTTGGGLVVDDLDSNGYTDGIRLVQAFRTGDAKATPIVPTNKRFAGTGQCRHPSTALRQRGRGQSAALPG